MYRAAIRILTGVLMAAVVAPAWAADGAIPIWEPTTIDQPGKYDLSLSVDTRCGRMSTEERFVADRNDAAIVTEDEYGEVDDTVVRRRVAPDIMQGGRSARERRRQNEHQQEQGAWHRALSLARHVGQHTIPSASL